MSKESAKKFIEDSKHNFNLKKEFENLLNSFNSNMSLQDKKSKAAKFMTKHGYDVIASDLKDDIFSKAHDSSDPNELSLDELDNVAGGGIPLKELQTPGCYGPGGPECHGFFQ